MKPIEVDCSDQKAQEFSDNLQLHRPGIAKYIGNIVFNKNDVDDILQRAAIIMWRKYSSFQPGTSFMAWAIKIAKYESFNFTRKIRRCPIMYGADNEVYIEKAMHPDDPYSHGLVDLETILHSLPKDMVELLKAVHVDNIDIRVLAARDGKSPRTYYNKLSLLRKKLMLALTEQHND